MFVMDEEHSLALAAFHLQPVGLLVCQATGEVQLANRAACALLDLASVPPGTRIETVLASFDTLEHLAQSGQPTITVGSAEGDPRQLGFQVTRAEGLMLVTLQAKRPTPWFRPSEFVEPSTPPLARPASRAPAVREVERIIARRAEAGIAFGLAECLHLAAIGCHSVVVGVEDARASTKGWVIVHQGQLWAARCGERHGDDAVLAMLATPAPRVEVEPLDAAPGAQEIHTPVETLLVSALDGPTTEHVESPTLPGAPVQEETGSPAAFAFFMEAGHEAILERNYPQAWRALRTAARLHPAHAGVRANLRRLASLGHAPADDSQLA